MTTNQSSATRCMIAMRDLATYIADSANYKLAPDYPFNTAFLDDDSDYLPAALDMMTELMTALTDDDPEPTCAALLDRITRNDTMLTLPDYHYTDLPLDAPCDLPFADID